MWIRPAETCCGNWSLLHGVQMLSSCIVVVGFVRLITLVIPTEDRQERVHTSDALAAAQSIQTLVESLALVFGLQGMLAVVTRDPSRMRRLMWYEILCLVVTAVVFVMREVDACDAMQQYKKLHKDVKMDCQTSRYIICVEFVLWSSFCTYFIYIIWSAAVRMEAGEFRHPTTMFDHELAERAQLGDTWSPWAFARHGHGPPEGSEAFLSSQQRSSSGPGSAPQPFAGASHSLAHREQEQDIEQSQLEPFRGTPHRLD
eukprot:TRINITY_DN76194_c0_g1_i1.p1 TRINITY_DN76194_c0_g1~~TRINITY_DN76194_c0_g1_i1.p1  ORF type:complete len:258 (+),score=41.52 TRINITY_DN76194_c0_g1_i1:105-878(+)